MTKRVLLLILRLTALAGALVGPLAEADGSHSCPICTTYGDGSQCCVPCWCDGSGQIVACTNLFCPPAGGGGRD